MARRRNARSKKIKRRQRAKTVQDYLIELLQSAGKQPAELPNKAAVHLIKSSQRHRLPLPRRARSLFAESVGLPTPPAQPFVCE